MKKWGIIRLMGGPLAVLNKAGTEFSPNIEDAMLFNTEAEARTIAQTIKTPTLVQELTLPELTSGLDFPVPDYFESPAAFMGLKELIEMIKADNLLDHFTPVDEITGAKQMTGGAITCPFNGRIIGRQFKFSFDRCLNDHDAGELYDVVRRTGAWESINYRRVRLGFTEYAVLTLQSKNN